MADGPFSQYRNRGKVVMARQVKRRKVVRTDRGEIVLDPGDWEIIGPDGTTYGNNPQQFASNYEEDRG